MEIPQIDTALRDELRNRTLGMNPKPVVFPIVATQKLNSDIAVAFRGSLQKKLWNFLVSDIDAEDYLIRTNKEYIDTSEDVSLRAWLLHPYVQSNFLVQECINLEMQLVSGYVKLLEPSTGRKDRYTMVSYLNYFVSEVLDQDLLREEDSGSDWDAIANVTMVL
jgi:hypothetical protein